MTDIEKKALALLNEVQAEYPLLGAEVSAKMALCRAIEQHEAFRQEVSDAVRVLDEFITGSEDYKRGSRTDGVHLADGRSVKFARFIIAKPDPLVEAFYDVDTGPGWNDPEDYIRQIRAAIEKRGGKITWGEG